MNLHDYLRAENISTEAFAAQLRVAAGSVRKWRYGERTPRPDAMRRIQVATGGKVTPMDFVGCEAAE